MLTFTVALALAGAPPTVAPDELADPPANEEAASEALPSFDFDPLRLRSPDDPFARSMVVSLMGALWTGTSVGTSFLVEQSFFRHLWVGGRAAVDAGQGNEHTQVASLPLGGSNSSSIHLGLGGRWVFNPGDVVELFGAAEARVSSRLQHVRELVFWDDAHPDGRGWDDYTLSSSARFALGGGAEWAVTDHFRLRFGSDLVHGGVRYLNTWGGTDPGDGGGHTLYQLSNVGWFAGLGVEPSLGVSLRF